MVPTECEMKPHGYNSTPLSLHPGGPSSLPEVVEAKEDQCPEAEDQRSVVAVPPDVLVALL